MAKGTYGVEKEDPTTGEFAGSLLKAKKGEVKPSTYKDYQEVLANHILPFFGKKRLSQVTPLSVQEFLLHLQEKGVSPATIRKVYRVFKAMIRRALALGLLDRDPTVGVSPPRVKRKEPRFLSPEEVERLLEITQGTDIGDIIAVAVLDGLRQGEIFALRWRNIDLSTRRISVVRSFHEVSGETDLKTASSRRAVPIPERLAVILEERYRRQGFPPPEALIFPPERGQ